LVEKIDIRRLERGSTFTFLELASQFEKGADVVTDAHFQTLVASLNAGKGLETRTYISRASREFVTLPTLEGPPLFAALFAFSKALRCGSFAVAARQTLKDWVVGDARAVGLAMVQLKWGADLKSSLPPDPSQQYTPTPTPSRILGPTAEFSFPDVDECLSILRGDDPRRWSAALDSIRRVALFDGHRITAFLPALVDGLAKECRDRILELFTIAIQTGFDCKAIMPILAGLLLDRDYYDSETVGRLYRCLIAAVDSGSDISMAWPYIGMCMEENGLKLKLLLVGAQKGLPTLGYLNFLLSHLNFSIVPHPSIEPSELTCGLEGAWCVLNILTLGASRRDFSRLQLDGEVS
jgi:hypothetical protein